MLDKYSVAKLTPAPIMFKASSSKAAATNAHRLTGMAAVAYPGEISLCERQVLLLPEWVPVENVLIIQQQQLGGVLAGPSPTSPFVSSPMTAPSLSSSFDALPLE